MSNIVRVIVHGLNAMVGKQVPFGAHGKVVEEVANGLYVEFSGQDEPLFVLPEQVQTVERCHSCEQLRINGVVTHETGCPDAWRDAVRECKECGLEFFPTERYQDCCSHSCQVSYYNLSCDCEECRECLPEETEEEVA
jgi:hypothetical protein